MVLINKRKWIGEVNGPTLKVREILILLKWCRNGHFIEWFALIRETFATFVALHPFMK